MLENYSVIQIFKPFSNVIFKHSQQETRCNEQTGTHCLDSIMINLLKLLFSIKLCSFIFEYHFTLQHSFYFTHKFISKCMYRTEKKIVFYPPPSSHIDIINNQYYQQIVIDSPIQSVFIFPWFT